MKNFLTGLVLCCLAGAAHADRIERACNKSDRTSTRATCSCIQKVADIKLTRSDQQLAAKFFADPQLAQDTRQSKDRRKTAFWDRYKEFGALAARACG